MIAVLDYGAGNLTSVSNVLTHLGHEHIITANPEQILAADRVIFPGVGAAGSAMAELKKRGLDVVLKQFIATEKPVMGICVGCQILLDHSEEDGGTPTLGFVQGKVKKFALEEGVKIPHMGWNQVFTEKNHPLWQEIPEGAEFYFVHSFYPVLAQKAHVLASSTYGTQKFDAAFVLGNVFATQFHAEKSGLWGLKLMDNFCKWNPGCGGGELC